MSTNSSGGAPNLAGIPFNLLGGAFFIIVGITALFTGDYLLGGAFASAGASLIAIGGNSAAWGGLPLWRRALALGLLGLAAVLFIVYVIITFG